MNGNSENQEKSIPYEDKSYLLGFINEMVQDDVNFSVNRRICKYVQKGLTKAYERLDCDNGTLYAIAKYDKAGIFGYFKFLSINYYESAEFKVSIISKSGKEIYLDYGRDNIVFLPTSLMPADEYYDTDVFASKVIKLCKNTIASLIEKLQSATFRDEWEIPRRMRNKM